MSYLKEVVASFQNGRILLPRLLQFLSKEEFRAKSEPGYHVSVVKADAARTIRAMRQRYVEFNHRKPGQYSDYFHPSAMGQCQRKLWFDHFGAPQNRRHHDDILKSFLIFEFGSALHVIIQNLCERAGILEAREFEIINHRQRIIGHGDGILRIDGTRYLLEVKSINGRQFMTVQKAPKPEHILQSYTYMKEVGLDWAIILYVEKDSSKVKEHVVQFDESVYQSKCITRTQQFHRKRAARLLPKREGSSPRQFPCSFCPFSNLCYTDLTLNKFVNEILARK